MDPLVYTINQALGLLPVSRSTLYTLISCGEIKPVKIGRRTFITGAELKRYVVKLERQ